MGIINCFKSLAFASGRISLNLGYFDNIYNVLGAILIGYLLSSISFSYIIYKRKTGGDIRTVGSGNAGASNLRRFLGTKFYILNLILDIGKGAVAVLFAQYLTEDPVAAAITGAAAIIGHSYPIWLKFKGGKSVAVTIGVFIPLNIFAVLIFTAVYFSLTGLLKIVSIASLTAALTLVLGCFFIDKGRPVLYLAIFAFLLILWRHRSNIGRLIRGEELAQKHANKTDED